MRQRFIQLILFFIIVAISNHAHGGSILSEGFEGPNSFKWYSESQNNWVTISNFVGSGFSSPFVDAKYSNIAKDTSIKHSGNASIRLFSSSPGGTSEFSTNKFSQSQRELWISWWERISSDSDINIGWKWWHIELDHTDGSNYLNWQTWDGGTDTSLCRGRVLSFQNPSRAHPRSLQTPNALLFPVQKSYQYKIHVKLNDVNSSNGIFKVWLSFDEGRTWKSLWNLENIKLICNVQRDMIALRFGGTRVTSSGDGPSRGTKWIDDIKVGTTEADVAGSSSSSSSSQFLMALHHLLQPLFE